MSDKAENKLMYKNQRNINTRFKQMRDECESHTPNPLPIEGSWKKIERNAYLNFLVEIHKQFVGMNADDILFYMNDESFVDCKLDYIDKEKGLVIGNIKLIPNATPAQRKVFSLMNKELDPDTFTIEDWADWEPDTPFMAECMRHLLHFWGPNSDDGWEDMFQKMGRITAINTTTRTRKLTTKPRDKIDVDPAVNRVFESTCDILKQHVDALGPEVLSCFNKDGDQIKPFPDWFIAQREEEKRVRLEEEAAAAALQKKKTKSTMDGQGEEAEEICIIPQMKDTKNHVPQGDTVCDVEPQVSLLPKHKVRVRQVKINGIHPEPTAVAVVMDENGGDD